MQNNKVKFACVLDEQTYNQLLQNAESNNMSLNDYVNEGLKLLNTDRIFSDKVSDTTNSKEKTTL